MVDLLADFEGVRGLFHCRKEAAPAGVAPKRGVGLTIFNPLTAQRSLHRCNISSDRDRRRVRGGVICTPRRLVACTLVALQTLTKSAGIFGPATSARLPMARLRSSTWMTTGAVASAGLATS
jgi:hypothetical protein